MGSKRTAEIRRLRLQVPQVELDTLYDRLRAYRRSGGYVAAGLDRVVPAVYADDLLDYWTDGYDWRRHEKELARHDHYATEIAGQFVHFVHHRSGRPPVLLTHAWPSGFSATLEAAEALQADHDVVVPSIAWTALASDTYAEGWNQLMRRLGYEHYVIGDNQTGVAEQPSYTVATSPAPEAERRGLEPNELSEVRWFNQNLTGVTQDRQLAALVLSTALMAWHAQLSGTPLDRDALLTDLTFAWFIPQASTE